MYTINYNTPMKRLSNTIAKALLVLPLLMVGLTLRAQTTITTITSLSDITDMAGNYQLAADITLTGGNTTFSSDFTGTLDGNFHTISGLTQPLFSTVNGGKVCNLILSDVQITTATGYVGAIAQTASGATRIYNCGIIDTTSQISGGTHVGSLVGYLQDNSRVINCYSHATVSGTTWAAGIVGYNAEATTRNTIASKTLVMNCMFYGDITGSSTNISPVYGGEDITNVGSVTTTTNNNGNNNRPGNNNTTTTTTYGGYGGINGYNYYRNESDLDNITAYNSTGAAESDYLTRFEYYRYILNSNRRLAAYYINSDATQTDIVAKWILDPSRAPYPILQPQGFYHSVINPDYENGTRRDTCLPYQGKRLGTLQVTVKGSSTDNGGTSDSEILTLNITDMDTLHYDFTYGKVQLPYFNEVFGLTANYGEKVVTGWKIIKITGGTPGDFTTTGDNRYNFADRDCTNKDLYSVSGRVFAQGGYFIVPNGVTAITIEPYWADAVYLADPYDDVVHNASYTKYDYDVLGQRYTNGSSHTINGHNVTVYTSLANAMAQLSTSAASVYDQAVVLVGNFHAHESWSYSEKPYTIMSVDLDNDREPDYNLYIYQYSTDASDKEDQGPARWDFLAVIGQGMATHVGTNTLMPSVVNFKHIGKGWFEITETSWAYFSEFEMDKDATSRQSAPIILNGGIFDQYETVANGNSSKLSYIILGGHVYIPLHSPGCHPQQDKSTVHPPITVLGGEYQEFYLSGKRASAPSTASNAICYAAGGYFHLYAGAYMEQINGNVIHKMDHILAGEFYGGGVNKEKPITGDITTTINNSYVRVFCGGPKFGDMASGKKVTTTATGSTFGQFFGAGYGGTNYYIAQDAETENASTFPSGWYSSYFSNSYLNYTSDRGYKVKFLVDHFKYAGGVDTKVIARFNNHYASFSLAQTNDVSSTLTRCTVLQSFYGGGSLGYVNGSTTSVLDSCTVYGNAFAGGYSATIPTIDVYVNNSSQFTRPVFNQNTGVFTKGSYPSIIKYTWQYSTGTTADATNHVLYTSENMNKLGRVELNTKITVKGNSVVHGNVYGGGNMSTVGGNTEVIIGERQNANAEGLGQ